MKRIIVLTLCLVMCASFIGCTKTNKPEENPPEKIAVAPSKNLRRVNQMERVNKNYKYIDYEELAKKQDAIVYSFLNNPEYVEMNPQTYAPVGYWDNYTKNYESGKTFGIPSYIGHKNAQGHGSWRPGMQESITVLGSLLGSTYAGIDKSDQNGYDLIQMVADDYIGSEGLVLNKVNDRTGNTFWYELFPQVLYSRIFAEYPDKQDFKKQILSGADKWVNALPYFKDENGNTSFKFQSFNFAQNTPVYADSMGRSWLEPSQGAISYILYCAYMIETDTIKKAEYLNYMKFCMDNLDKDYFNGYYEVMQDYNPLMAAIMNFEFGTNYDVEKQLNYIFDADSSVRPDLGIITGDFGDKYMGNGLMGSNAKSASYAFAMNTFHLASVLAPIAKYDSRFATDIGRWFLNASNNARVFFPNEVAASNQSMGGAFFLDPDGTIPYEGARHTYRNKTPYAMGDPTTVNPAWGQTDYGLYGGAMVGMFGGIIDMTNVDQILRLDLNKTDSFGDKTYAQYLYYNPYEQDKDVKIILDKKSKLFDKTTNQLLGEFNAGEVLIKIPASGSRVITIIPSSTPLTKEGYYIKAGGKNISRLSPILSMSVGNNNQKQTVKGTVEFKFDVSSYSPLENMSVKIDGKKVYGGAPTTSFKWDTKGLPNGDYLVEAEIKTQDKQTDRTTIVLTVINDVAKNPDTAPYSWVGEEFGLFKELSAHITMEDGNAKITSNNGTYGSVQSEELLVDFDRNPMIYMDVVDVNFSYDIQFAVNGENRIKYVVANHGFSGLKTYSMNTQMQMYNGERPLSGKRKIKINIQPREGEGSYVTLKALKVYYPSARPSIYTVYDVIDSTENILTEKI